MAGSNNCCSKQPPPSIEKSLSSLKLGSALSEKASMSQTQEETTSENLYEPVHVSRSGDILCTTTTQEEEDDDDLPVPVYIPTHPSKSGDNDDNPDDDGSVSSLDSYEQEDFPMASAQRKTKRPIFNDYWKLTNVDEVIIDDRGGSTNSSAIPITAKDSYRTTLTTTATTKTSTAPYTYSGSAPIVDEFAYQEFRRDFTPYDLKNNASDIYEDILKVNEVGRTVPPNATSLKEVQNETTALKEDVNRRSFSNSTISTTPKTTRNTNARVLFTNKYSQSSPSLLSYGYREQWNNPVRKTSSSSSLRKKKQRSCLRRSRSCSVDSTALGSVQSSLSKLSVSFDSKVCVHEYEKPYDRYTANGWSKWFV